MSAQIEHPDYYNSGGIEAADFIDAQGLNFNLGNVVKYIARAGKKGSESKLTALQKAQWYLNREISCIEQLQEHQERIMKGMRPAVFDPEHYSEDAEDIVTDWDKEFSALFTEGMHERICSNSKQIYVVMREICPILDMLLIEENYDRPLTVHVRERLACVLRLIDH